MILEGKESKAVSIRAEKKEIGRERKERWRVIYNPRVSAEQRRRELLCFWTHPFGHQWKSCGQWDDVCLICGKISKDPGGDY